MWSLLESLSFPSAAGSGSKRRARSVDSSALRALTALALEDQKKQVEAAKNEKEEAKKVEEKRQAQREEEEEDPDGWQRALATTVSTSSAGTVARVERGVCVCVWGGGGGVVCGVWCVVCGVWCVVWWCGGVVVWWCGGVVVWWCVVCVVVGRGDVEEEEGRRRRGW